MFLRPHHFQQQERYLESLSAQQVQATNVMSVGFTQLELLKTNTPGEVGLAQASGIWTNGLPFTLTANDVDPLVLPSGEIKQRLCLILPDYQEGMDDIVFDDEPGTNARYVVEEIEVADSSEIALGASTVQVGKPRFRLCLEKDVPPTHSKLYVASIQEVNSAGLMVQELNYIPQIIQTQASPVLSAWVQEIERMLEQRVSDLVARLQQVGRSTAVELTDLLTLQTINHYRGVFTHLVQLGQLHPERVYRDFVSLAYELATFTQAKRTRDAETFPKYQHDQLKKSFEPLVLMLKNDLSYVMKAAAVHIDLIDKTAGLKVAKVDDLSLLKESKLVLAVNSDLPLDTLAQRFPTQSKLGAVDKIRDLVHLQLPGIKLSQMSGTPPQLPYEPNKIYFALEQKGDLWDSFEQTGLIALHLAGEFPGLGMDFWALREL